MKCFIKKTHSLNFLTNVKIFPKLYRRYDVSNKTMFIVNANYKKHMYLDF